MRAQLYDFLGEMRKALPDGHGSGDGSTTDEQAKLAAILYYNQLQGLHRRLTAFEDEIVKASPGSAAGRGIAAERRDARVVTKRFTGDLARAGIHTST